MNLVRLLRLIFLVHLGQVEVPRLTRAIERLCRLVRGCKYLF